MQYRTELYTVKSKSKCDGKVTGYNEKMTEDDIYNTECIRFERYFLSMGNCLEDFWSIMRKDMNGFSREEEEAFIGEYKNVLIVMSESYMTDINVLYYMDILRSLKEKGHINIVAMIQNGTVIPERYRWITGPEVSRIAFY